MVGTAASVLHQVEADTEVVEPVAVDIAVARLAVADTEAEESEPVEPVLAGNVAASLVVIDTEAGALAAVFVVGEHSYALGGSYVLGVSAAAVAADKIVAVEPNMLMVVSLLVFEVVLVAMERLEVEPASFSHQS